MDAPYSDPNGRKVSVTKEQLQQFLEQQKAGRLVMRDGVVSEEQPRPIHKLTPEQQRDLFLRAQQTTPYGKLERQLQQDDYVPADTFGGLNELDVEENRLKRQEALSKVQVEREAKKIEAQREKGDYSDELSSFLRSSNVYQDLKTKVASPTFFETFSQFFSMTVVAQFEKLFPILVKKHIRTFKPGDLEKRIGNDIVNATELKALPKEGRAMVWHFRPRDTDKRNFYVICYDGKVSFVKKYGNEGITERFLEDVLGDIKSEYYVREVLYTEMLDEIQNLLGIADGNE
jgi:hypothetical protein